MRRASRSIAEDECRHAELALAVARWTASRLTATEGAAVKRATTEAIEELRAHGNQAVVALLSEHVWNDDLVIA